MKVISILNNEMVIREQRRSVDRDADMLTVYLSIEAKFGTVVNADTRRKQRQLTFQVEKARHPEVWAAVKDADNGALMDAIADQLSAVLPVVRQHRMEEENPVTREAIQETVDGEVLFRYRDEDEAAFSAARERTGHAPTQVPQPNSQEAALEELKAQYPVEEIDDMVSHLLAIGVEAPLRAVGV